MHVGGLGLDAGPLEQVADAHAGPRRVELRPLGDAVDVAGQGDRWQRLQLREVEAERPVDQTGHLQVPRLGVVRRDVADVQHGEAVGQVLAGRQAGGVVPALDELGPVALEEAHRSSVPRHGHRYARRADRVDRPDRPTQIDRPDRPTHRRGR